MIDCLLDMLAQLLGTDIGTPTRVHIRCRRSMSIKLHLGPSMELEMKVVWPRVEPASANLDDWDPEYPPSDPSELDTCSVSDVDELARF